MCGIAGLVFPRSRPASLEGGLLRAFAAKLAHRGPDDEGFFALGPRGPLEGGAPPGSLDATLVLLHRRLSIIEPTRLGHQPMSTPGGELTVVFNGEVYNHVELGKELEALGHSFRTRSDTEVLLHAWLEWGEEALGRFVGMFAFALLDRTKDRLVLARDPFGIKPLYTARWRGGIAFASEIPALLALPGIERGVNARRLGDYLASGLTDHGTETLFASVEQVAAGHWLSIPLEEPVAKATRFFALEPRAEPASSRADAAARIREVFLENVRLHLRSDVPLGAALSGGIDSSSIVAAMRHVAGKDLELHAFSYVADDARLSEERWVDLVAGAVSAKVRKVHATPEELVRDLDALVAVQGEPFGSTSIYAQSRVFRAAREAGVKVMLDGQGADELLAGYLPGTAVRIAALARRGHVVEAAKLLARASRLPGREGLLGDVARRSLPLFVKRATRALRPKREARAVSESWFRERGAWPIGRPAVVGDGLTGHLVELVSETSLPMLLRYEDRNAMAHSIESRVPFLTVSLARELLALPEEFLVAPDGTTKSIFREAMKGLVPDAILERRDKIGFATPERSWLQAVRPWAESVLGGETARRVRVLDLAAVKREWDAALAGERAFDFRLWRWINLVRWAEIFSVSFE